MPDAAITAEPTESATDESTADEKEYSAKRLDELLADFDEHQQAKESEGLKIRNDEEIEAFRSQIETLRAENGDLTERAEKAEAHSEIIDESLARIDKHDLSQIVERIAKASSLTQAAAEREIELRFYKDESFAAIADARFDSPEEFESALESIVDDLAEEFPQREDHRSISRAVRIARSSHIGNGSYAEADYPDLSKLNDREFDTASRQIFEDMRTGKLRPEGGKTRGGFITTYPR